MTTAEQALWEKIQNFELDNDRHQLQFSNRLARENGWTKAFTLRVIEEYRKFLFLCCISPTGVTPSDAVDQAWHLHLTYTRSYWIDLCRDTLGKELHHNPTKGGRKEGEKFGEFYDRTFKVYVDSFNAIPPLDIWPNNEQRFSDIHFRRVNLQRYELVERGPDHSLRNFLKWMSAVLLCTAWAYVFFAYPAARQFLFIGAVLVMVIMACVKYNVDDDVNTADRKRSDGGCSGGSGCTSDDGPHHGHDSNYGGGHDGGHGCSSGCSGCSGSGCSGCGGGCGGD